MAGAGAILNAQRVIDEQPLYSETYEAREIRVAKLTNWQWDAMGLLDKLEAVGV